MSCRQPLRRPACRSFASLSKDCGALRYTSRMYSISAAGYYLGALDAAGTGQSSRDAGRHGRRGAPTALDVPLPGPADAQRLAQHSILRGAAVAGISSPRAADYLGSADSSSSLLRTPSFT